MTEQVTLTFKDFVLQVRKWQKWATGEIEGVQQRMSQLESAFGMNEDTLNEVRDEVTHKLADMFAMLEETNGMLSELLDNMPSDSGSDDDVEPDVDEQKENEDFAHDGELDNIPNDYMLGYEE